MQWHCRQMLEHVVASLSRFDLFYAVMLFAAFGSKFFCLDDTRKADLVFYEVRIRQSLKRLRLISATSKY